MLCTATNGMNKENYSNTDKPAPCSEACDAVLVTTTVQVPSYTTSKLLQTGQLRKSSSSGEYGKGSVSNRRITVKTMLIITANIRISTSVLLTTNEEEGEEGELHAWKEASSGDGDTGGGATIGLGGESQKGDDRESVGPSEGDKTPVALIDGTVGYCVLCSVLVSRPSSLMYLSLKGPPEGAQRV
ncbi:hypothetical protein ACLOJK_021642 [Asimina triloba]